ncbi:MAG TPA: acetyl-CoA carboxylase biotin carboxyl carrier protein [Planctomycetaceae bacterium]|nr:acetyl-CoA carboxylase biotin carboxyl carrier protein [Planctomycetaceae bacterium]
MSAEPTGASEPFDLDKLRELIGLMEAHGLSEIDLRRGEERWKLRRGPSEVMQMVPAPGYAPGPLAPLAPAPAPAPAAAKPADDPNVVPIKSPTVGTFYESSAPGDAPFVAIGTKVTQESVVCIIEAMKVFNQITADVNGTVTEVLVKNGDAVEFGQPLFRVRLG